VAAKHRTHANLHHHREAIPDGFLKLLTEPPLSSRAEKPLPGVGGALRASLVSSFEHRPLMAQNTAVRQMCSW
ncbi:MAG: hypothetical protein V3W41_01715, partial [Planctomycetota bacterium]